MSPNLDILRAIAVLLVLCYHYAPQNWGVPTELGRAGVLLFFVHTALVLMQSLDRIRVSGQRLLSTFAIRRIFRIYPLSICAVLLCLVFRVPVSGSYQPPSALKLGLNLALMQNLLGGPLARWTPVEYFSLVGPLWSLPYEVQMYCVLPFIYLGLRKWKWKWPWVTVFILLMASFAVVRIEGVLEGSAGRPGTLTQFVPCFISGVLSYWLLGQVRRTLPASLWLPTVLAFVGLYVFGTWLPMKPSAVCLLLSIAIPFFRENTSRILTTMAAQVAKYSYGLYLCHAPVFWFVFVKWRFSGFVGWLVLVGVLTTSVLTAYHLIEEPMIRIGKRCTDVQPPSLRRPSPHA